MAVICGSRDGLSWWVESSGVLGCAQLVPRQERLATHCLGLAGFTVYAPGVREKRAIRGGLVEMRVPLFLNYCFMWIELQWHGARWAPGVARLVMDGERPARVPDVIDELRKREVGGLIELSRPSAFRSWWDASRPDDEPTER